MTKTIHLNFDNLPDPTYQKWARETVSEFLDLFPEYKGHFRITTRPIMQDLVNKSFSGDQLNQLIAETRKINNAPAEADLRNVFQQQADGTYKFKTPSKTSYDGDARQARSFLWMGMKQLEGIDTGYSHPVEIWFPKSNGGNVLGKGGMMSGACLFIDKFEASAQGYDATKKKAFFKFLLTHEIGHVFQAAVDTGRRSLDTSSPGLPHCRDAGCVMQSNVSSFDSLYDPRNPNKPVPFCNDCANDIRMHMEQIKQRDTAELNNDIQEDNGIDYDEPDGDHLPKTVRDVKKYAQKFGVTIRATAENQQDYPFGYNLYQKGSNHEQSEPTGKMRIRSNNHISLDSKDLEHFVAMMRAFKENGLNTINLNLNRGDDTDKKNFAANAIIAATLTGVKIHPLPYPLEELRGYGPNGMMEKIINIEEQRKNAHTASEAYETAVSTNATDVSAKETELENAITDVYQNYRHVATNSIPDLDHMQIAQCGVNNIARNNSRIIAQRVLNAARGHTP